VRLFFVIGHGASMLPLLSKVLDDESKEHQFEYFAINSDLFDLSPYIKEIEESDAILLYTHELSEGVEDALKRSKARIIAPLFSHYLHLSRGSLVLLSTIEKYFKIGGERNLKNLIHLILRELGLSVDVGPVENVPWDGIYHPRLGVFNDLESYLQAYKLNKPVVGILFYRNSWLYSDLQFINDLIDSIEREGISVIPVFTQGFRDVTTGAPSKEDSIRKFFMKGGKPVIDLLINTTFFFLLDHGEWEKREFASVEGVKLLKEINVPIVNLVLSYYQSVDEWLASPQGVDYLMQVFAVVMPEVDGAIEPIFIAGARVGSDGVKRYETYRPHAGYIARRVKKWIELRQKPPSERRIAIILINPACKGLEANVGATIGLDSPESIAKLLHKLKELGYNVGDESRLPKDGNELIKMIMDRRAISEFRWTSVEEIVKRGGAIAFVDEKTYLEWFNELPEDVKKKMVKEWGHPSDVLNGKINKQFIGMVYDHKFVIPGIKFGNIIIMPQPKPGCTGPACNGEVCKVLHDPTISPPHQWLALYRWITRIFKADVIIHFGTHGYLEFRPGKGVGLSPSCWPEISIDDVPHLYVYVVSNPMEGVIAKRRSYAEIIDHMYPPMAMAEVLEELELLLNQYAKAKQSGDFTRAEVAYKEMLEKARKNNVPIRGRSPEEVVEEVHRYLDMVRGTQINMGLHVFGYSPTDPSKLANYAVTVMAYDSHNLPSIIRTIAEYVGLDYDEMRADPLRVNELGMTNSETLEVIRKIAVKVVETLIRSPELKSNILEVLDEELRSAFGGEVRVKV